MTIEELYHNIGGNYENIVKRLADKEKVKKYIKYYINDTSYATMSEARQKGLDDEYIFLGAHDFKGVCLNLSLDDMSNVICKIVEHYRPEAQVPCDNIEELFDILEQKHQYTIEQIKLFIGSEE